MDQNSSWGRQSPCQLWLPLAFCLMYCGRPPWHLPATLHGGPWTLVVVRDPCPHSPSLHHIFAGARQSSPPKIRNEIGCQLSSVLFDRYFIGSSSQSNLSRRIKGTHIGKDIKKTSIHRWDDLHRGHLKEHTKKLLDLINKFSKMIEYKINT